ncbi:hypothetical protein BDF19DRAFT_425235 [Syncephalis fuscata]|nr:hypothetical protein BDF19DRAFT_425235 [Syncephalis fuscata]
MEMALSAEASMRQELACNSMDMDNYQNDRMDDINDQESQYWEEAMMVITVIHLLQRLILIQQMILGQDVLVNDLFFLMSQWAI